MDAKPIRFISEPIQVHFDKPPALEKKPGVPDRFAWRGDTYRVVELLAEWVDYRRRGRMARNMQPQHAAVAERRGSWGVGKFYFHNQILGSLLFTAALTLAALACSIGGLSTGGNASTTATAQAERIRARATQMGVSLQGTREAQTVHATAAAQAWQAELKRFAGGSLLISDDFDDNTYDWPAGDDFGSYVDITSSIVGGKYRWEVTANDNFIYWARPAMDYLTDFYLSVETQMVSGPADGTSGVAFRILDPENYYLFRIDNENAYQLSRAGPESWATILDWDESPAIRPYEANAITIIARGARFYIFVNDHFIAEAFDDTLPEGRAGVAAGMYNPGERGVFEFDSFELRRLP